MGSFMTSDKSGYFWFLLGYLQDNNIYVRDNRLLPYTPGKPQTYVDFYPQFYGETPTAKVTFKINGQQVAQALVSQVSGIVYADIPVQLGKFTLTTWLGTALLKTEEFISKNFAMLLGVQAQSYNERLADLQAVAANQSFQTIQSDSLYGVVGANFSFPPPPGWTPQQYRDALLGGCGPGILAAALMGTTQGAISAAVEAVTCQPPQIGPIFGGNRWTVRNRANTFPSNPAVKGFYVTSRADSGHVFVAPHYRAVTGSELWWSKAVSIAVPGSQRTVVKEVFQKQTNSFLQAGLAEPFVLDGATLTFSVAQVGNPDLTLTYSTVFPIGTSTAALAAAAIIAQNSSLATIPTNTDPIYANNGYLRIGVQSQFGIVFRITAMGGTSLPILGWVAGQSADSACEQLANPWIVYAPLAFTLINLYLPDGTPINARNYNLDATTGSISWVASSFAEENVPVMGSTLLASYTYEMRREVLKLVSDVQETNDELYFSWLP